MQRDQNADDGFNAKEKDLLFLVLHRLIRAKKAMQRLKKKA